MRGRLLIVLAAGLLLFGGAAAWRSLDLDGEAVSSEPVVPDATAREPFGVGSEPLVDVDRDRVRALPTSAGEGPYRVRVVDEEGEPISGATAWVDGEDSLRVSGDDGELRFVARVRLGVVVASGYLPRPFSVFESSRTVELEPDPGLELTLRWSDGAPVAGAGVELHQIELERAQASLPGLAPPVAPTDANGRTRVEAHRVGSVPALLRVRPPGVEPLWVALSGGIEERDGRPTCTVHLPRTADVHHVRVVDASGAPLAGRTVRMRHGVEATSRTDAEGYATFPALLLSRVGSYDAVTGYAIELEREGSWWYEERETAPSAGTLVELVVASQRVHGRLVGGPSGMYRVATLGSSDVGDGLQGVRLKGWPIAPNWQPVAQDGGFDDLPGWQGPQTWVAVRHRDREDLIAYERVPSGGGPLEIVVPEVCLVTVTLDRTPDVGTRLNLYARVEEPTGDEAEGRSGSVRFVRMGNIRISDVSLARREQTLELPRATYGVNLLVGSASLGLVSLDATGPTAELEFELPPLVRVRGEVLSTLRGPIAELSLKLGSDRGRVTGEVVTDARGRFELDLPASGPIHVRPDWGWEQRHLRLRPEVELVPPIDPEEPTARYVIEEARLRVTEVPPSPMLHGFRLELDPHDGPGSSSALRASRRFGREGLAEAYLPPGTYDLTRRFDGRREQRVEVTLAVGEERELVLDCSGIAVLALNVVVSDPPQRQLRVRVRDARGGIVDFDSARRLESEPYAYREVVDPGTYSVRVESYRRGARIADDPVDVWSGEVTAVPGAQAPLRVFLN